MVPCLIYCVPVPLAPLPAKNKLVIVLGVKPTIACPSPNGQSTHME